MYLVMAYGLGVCTALMVAGAAVARLGEQAR